MGEKASSYVSCAKGKLGDEIRRIPINQEPTYDE
jgi:hypothetical protein